MTTDNPYDDRWGNPVWILREAAAMYEAAGEAEIARRLERMAADYAAGEGGTPVSDPLPMQREQLHADFAKGKRAFLRILADVFEARYSDDTGHDLRTMRMALEAPGS